MHTAKTSTNSGLSIAVVVPGLRVADVLITAGVGNVTDTVYHPPYGGINGLARHFFINLTYGGF